MSVNGKVVMAMIDSAALAGNPLGDPARRLTPVYLPPGYADGNERYPSIYLLAGFTGRGAFMLNDSGFDETIQERLDRLIAAGQIAPMIVVMPDGFTRYGGSQYLNSSATGRYEDHLIDEVIPYIDRNFRTDPARRAIAGKSSGGFGAMVQAMRHPDLFAAVASHSGDMVFDHCYRPDIPKFLMAAARNNIDSYETLRDFLAAFQPKMFPKPPAFFDVIHLAAMSACYSPNLQSPTGFDLPFEFYTGQFRPEVWQRWLAFDPVVMLDSPLFVAALRRMKLVYLDCGRQDEYALQFGARTFSRRLTELSVPHRHEEFDGGHRNTQHRYDVSLAAISQVLVR